MRKLLLFAPLISVLLIGYANAQTTGSELLVNADTMAYSEDGTTLEAYGSVEAFSKDMSLEAGSLNYNLKTKDITVLNGFTMMLKGGMVIKGEQLHYNLDTQTGITQNVEIRFRRSVLDGEIAYLAEDRIELRGASFNTCGLNPPHYHVSSTTTTLYPEDGWVIGYWGFLWISTVPVVPVPVYMYDLKAQSVAGQAEVQDVLSMPEVGSNDDDGYYVSYKVPWIYNKKLTGRFTPLYTQNGGLGIGMDGLYQMNDSNNLNFRVNYDPRYLVFGGVTHSYLFGGTTGTTETTVYNFLQVKQPPMYELDTNVSYRERVNYMRVSMLPNITLRLNDIPYLIDNFHVSGQVSYGHITESSEETAANGSEVGQLPLTESDVGNMQGNGTFSLPSPYGLLELGAGYNQSWYGFQTYWSRLWNSTRFSNQFTQDLDGYIRHLHYINYTGNSIFQYEMYREVPSDEIGFGLGYNLGDYRFTFDFSYYVPDWDVQDLDYSLERRFHCYSVNVMYRAARNETLFGFSLIY